ncbi:MAG: NADH-quinone oxidoreductase subunit N [Phycisphaeraceae bacterium]|nr:NADH-quinone oxidoreductase subunit N [Phycisphaeraceae bacterium]
MIDRIAGLYPEIALFITTCVVMVIGLSPSRSVRRLCGPLSAVGLVAAWALAARGEGVVGSSLPGLAYYYKQLVCAAGLLLVPLLQGTVDREYEAAVARGARFDAIRSNTAEFYSFFLFSLTGCLLCGGAPDLIWLFLALELTSLPTYVMVAISTRGNRSMEAAVKYFFLGALSAAVFLYGFALLYGATGTTSLAGIQASLAAQHAAGGISPLAVAGVLMIVLGLCFKIAAVPMQFYAADVYQGAASPVSAMLAFVPKAAGFAGLMLVLSAVGWSFGSTPASTGESLPPTIRLTLWVVAVLTMFTGNVLAVLQTSVKRLLAYSSIAHSGYMLVGLIAGPGETVASNGLSAVLFYLTCYAAMTIGAFAVVASIERRTPDGSGDEAESIADLRGLYQSHPLLAWVMVICSMGLLGLPPLLGFMGKLTLFTSGISKGEIVLVIVLCLNSAISAYYYLRLAYMALLEAPDAAPIGRPVVRTPFNGRVIAGFVGAAGVVALVAVSDPLSRAAFDLVQTQPLYKGTRARPVAAGAEGTPAPREPQDPRTNQN